MRLREATGVKRGETVSIREGKLKAVQVGQAGGLGSLPAGALEVYQWYTSCILACGHKNSVSSQVWSPGKTDAAMAMQPCLHSTLHLKPTVSPLMIPLVYCHINSFQRASSMEKPFPGGPCTFWLRLNTIGSPD